MRNFTHTRCPLTDDLPHLYYSQSNLIFGNFCL
jgi:hypothetical protein